MRRLLALVLLLGCGVTALPVAAQTGSEDAVAPIEPLEVSLHQIDAVLAADDPDDAIDAVLQVQAGAQPRTDLRLVTTVYTRADGRAALQEVADGVLPPVFSAQSSDLPDLAAGTTTLVTTTTPRDVVALSDPGRAGVYPLHFQVFQGGDPVGAVLTSLIVLPEEGPAPIPATTVLRVWSPGAAPLGPDGVPASLASVVAPDSHLRAFARDVDALVGDGSAAGVTVAASGRLLGDLQAMSGGFSTTGGQRVAASDMPARRAAEVVDQVRRLSRRADTEVLALPYGPADLVALVRGGLDTQALQLVDIGIDRTADVLGVDPTGGILVPPDGLDAPTVAALGPAQIDAVLIDQRYLAFADDGLMQPVRRLRTADGGEVQLLVPDTDLSQLLADPRQLGSAWVVQDLLARTAVQWLTMDPAEARTTGTLIAVDVSADLPDGIISTATRAISAAPWLRPVGLSQLALEVRPSDRVVRLAYPPRSAASELDAGYIRRLGEAHEALGPLAALLPEGDRTPARFAEQLLSAASVAYRDDADQQAGVQRSRQVLDRLAALGGAVQIVPSAPITLTSTTGEVPVTLANTGDVPVRVRVVLSSSRFDFPGPGGGTRDLTLDARASVQLEFAAESLNPGGFAAITVTVQDPIAGSTLDETRMSVRSTAFPVVGLIAVIGSALVFVWWGLKQSLRRRRPGRHEATTARRRSGAA